jgi:hypothetical protein
MVIERVCPSKGPAPAESTVKQFDRDSMCVVGILKFRDESIAVPNNNAQIAQKDRERARTTTEA